MLDRKSYVLGSAQNAELVKAHENSDRLYAGCMNDDGHVHPYQIVMVLESAVIVLGSFADEYGTVVTGTYDEMGQCLRRVQNADVKFVYTQQDSDNYQECVTADQRMLENAY